MTPGDPLRMSLLDDLSWQLGCDYISDLKLRLPKWLLYQAILSLPADRYPLEQWMDAMAYLAVPTPCESAQQARDVLLTQLNEVPQCHM